MFAAENGLRGDPRLQGISKAIRVVPDFPIPGFLFFFFFVFLFCVFFMVIFLFSNLVGCRDNVSRYNDVAVGSQGV